MTSTIIIMGPLAPPPPTTSLATLHGGIRMRFNDVTTHGSVVPVVVTVGVAATTLNGVEEMV
jgi:hypothetical protein